MVLDGSRIAAMDDDDEEKSDEENQERIAKIHSNQRENEIELRKKINNNLKNQKDEMENPKLPGEGDDIPTRTDSVSSFTEL